MRMRGLRGAALGALVTLMTISCGGDDAVDAVGVRAASGSGTGTGTGHPLADATPAGDALARDAIGPPGDALPHDATVPPGDAIPMDATPADAPPADATP